MVGGPSIVFTRNAVADETLVRDLTNLCKSSVRIDASQPYPFSMCQALPTGLHTRWEMHSQCGNFKLRQDRTRSYENMVMSYFQRVRPQCKVESFYMEGIQKKMMHTVLMAFVDTAILFLKLWDAIFIFVYVKKLVHLPLRAKFNEELKRES